MIVLSAFFGRCLYANINKEGALTRLGGKMGVIWTNLEGKVSWMYGLFVCVIYPELSDGDTPAATTME